MAWYAAIALIVLVCIALIYLYYRRRMVDQGSGNPAHPQVVRAGSRPAVQVPPEPEPPVPGNVEAAQADLAEPEPPYLKAVLRADLDGKPGYFATRWERQAAYRLAVEMIGEGPATTHDIASGYLHFWRGGEGGVGAGKSMHDEGYIISEEDFQLIKRKLEQLLLSLEDEGWSTVQTIEWVRQTMSSSEFGIQVRFRDKPYDESPRPGTYERVLLTTAIRQTAGREH